MTVVFSILKIYVHECSVIGFFLTKYYSAVHCRVAMNAAILMGCSRGTVKSMHNWHFCKKIWVGSFVPSSMEVESIGSTLKLLYYDITLYFLEIL